MSPLPLVIYRSQEKKEEAVTLLKDSIRYGPDFADAYSSLASLLAEQVIVSFSFHIIFFHRVLLLMVEFISSY